jgi:hypothetical protein
MGGGGLAWAVKIYFWETSHSFSRNRVRFKKLCPVCCGNGVNFWSQEENDLTAEHTPNLTSFNDTPRINVSFYLQISDFCSTLPLIHWDETELYAEQNDCVLYYHSMPLKKVSVHKIHSYFTICVEKRETTAW